MLKVKDENFDSEVYDSDRPVLVAFLAKWCWICNMFRPELELLSSRISEEVKFCEVDIDESPDLKNYFSVDSVPKSILFLDGKERGQLRAGWPQQKVLQFLEEELGRRLTSS